MQVALILLGKNEVFRLDIISSYVYSLLSEIVGYFPAVSVLGLCLKGLRLPEGLVNFSGSSFYFKNVSLDCTVNTVLLSRKIFVKLHYIKSSNIKLYNDFPPFLSSCACPCALCCPSIIIGRYRDQRKSLRNSQIRGTGSNGAKRSTGHALFLPRPLRAPLTGSLRQFLLKSRPQYFRSVFLPSPFHCRFFL